MSSIAEKTRQREKIIDQDYLKEALWLDEISGNLVWREDRPLEHFKNSHGLNTYKSKYAGKGAGYVTTPNTGSTKYLQIRLKNKLFLAHRLIWLYTTGDWPEGIIDHLDGNGLNNKIENLRDVEIKVNNRNKIMSVYNMSGYNGVYFSKCANKWIAEGGKKYLGCYSELLDAIAARVNWEQEVGGFTERHGKMKEYVNDLFSIPV